MRIDRFEREIQERDAENKKLRERIAELEEEIARLRARCGEMPPPPRREPLVSSYRTKAVKAAQSSYSVAQVEDIRRAYNSLPHAGGMNDRLARRAFIERYAIEGFSCVNAAERVNNARLAPDFRSEQPLKADYWAVPMGRDAYFVMPNQRQGYDENSNFAGAMGEVFESNFVTGRIYQRVRLDRPAFFRKDGERWELAQMRGKLTLS